MNISLLVKQQILQICDGPVHVPEKLPDNVPLSHLGYDEDESLCRALEAELKKLIYKKGSRKIIVSGLISEDMTVSECIELVVS